ncbi:hypothetical protein WQ54_10465 [Bacillus sp. SA1-12]|uniref:DinB family protein n=1 Tax=Bacillus sp. SA1-12 TaxID=1455638 RepID=UPI000625FDAF|nr:DinB family protein [Bacillus sp. SA1-12]KKI92236.1 hypothetical protein WQ54_10465 [Bacillus sp. SA1-12]
MGNVIFKQLRFARNCTLSDVKGINDQEALFIPAGFNNNIKWNLGHIYLIHERNAFYFIGEKMELPESFPALFAPGTKPAEWGEQQAPTVLELVQLLENQLDRIEGALESRLKEAVKQPYTTSRGLTLSTVEEFITFCLYHEGMHFDAIKMIKRMMQR